MAYPLRATLLLLAALAMAGAGASEDDTRRLLNQIDRNVAEREQSHLIDIDPAETPAASLITIGNTTYSVQNTLTDLEPALYVAINLQQWSKVRQFVGKYQALPGHDPALVLMAQGMLARSERDFGNAIARLREAVIRNPQLMRARLELGRTLFEDNQSREARRLFNQISTAGIPDATRPVIEGFQGALRERHDWHGSFSIGGSYNSNINQENGRQDTFEVCYDFVGCFPSTRKMPDPIGSSGLVYDLTLNRRLQIAGHHHILLRGISYGNVYSKHKEAATNVYYNENTSILYAGYNYSDALNELSITPFFENNYHNRQTRYRAAGVRLDWKHNLTDRLQLGLNAQSKRLRFKGEMARYLDGYPENQFGLYGSYMLGKQTVLYGGADYTRKLQSQAAARSREYTVNIGLYHQFDGGFNINAVALYRRIRNDKEDLFLGGRRKDRQQVYILNVGIPRFAFKGIVPNLYLKRTVNNSNIAWAYQYKQTEVAVKFEKRF